MTFIQRESGFLIFDGDSSAPDLWKMQSRYRSISKPRVLGIPLILSVLGSVSKGLKLLRSENHLAPIQLQCKITLDQYWNIERLVIYGTMENSTSEISEISELMPQY